MQKGTHLAANPLEGKDRNEKFPYREAIGSLLYVAACTRPDVMYAVCSLARFVSNPGPEHWKAVVQVIEYLKGTKEKGLHYWWNSGASQDQVLIPIPRGYSDASYNDDVNEGRSTIGFGLFLEKYLISWKSKLPSPVAQSIMEAEFIALNKLACCAIWMRDVLEFTFDKKGMPIIELYCDNDPGRGMAEGTQVTDRNRHIRPKYFYIRKMVQKELLSVKRVSSTTTCGYFH